MPENEIIYNAPEQAYLNKDDLDNLINEYIQNSLLPVWFQDLTKTALSRNITIDDWNTLCYLIRRVSADKVAYTTLKEFGDALYNFMNNNFSLKGHNLVSVRVENNELVFEFEDGGYFFLNERDFGLHKITQLELNAILK